MEAASVTVQIDPLHLLAATGQKPTAITIKRRSRSITFHQPTLFGHGHQHVLRGRKSHQLVHVVSDGATEMDGDDHGNKAREVLGASVVLACVLGSMCLSLPLCRPSPAYALFGRGPSEVRKKTKIKVMHGSTLEALLHMEERAVTPTEMDEALRGLVRKSNPPNDLADLQKAVRMLAFSGDTAQKAVGKLKDNYEQLQKEKKEHEAWIWGLALVEMYIYQGEYNEAKNLVEKLEKTVPSAADPRLYKAAISLMLGDTENASKCWDEYACFPKPDELKITITFKDFKRQINKLKQKINEKR